MESVYSSPTSDIQETETKELTFKTLGFWRKLYLVLNWLTVILAGVGVVFSVLLGGDQAGINLTSLVSIGVVLVLFVAYTYWLHVAVSRRQKGALTALTIIQIIPFMNPISALIMYAIRSTSVKELG